MDDLKAKLAVQEAELKQKNENADKLIQVVGVETEKVSKEKAIADEEEIKVEVINKVGPGRLPEGRVPPAGRTQAEMFVRGQTAQPREPQERRPYPYLRLYSKRVLRECPQPAKILTETPPRHTIAVAPLQRSLVAPTPHPIPCHLCCAVLVLGRGADTEPRTSHTLTKKC